MTNFDDLVTDSASDFMSAFSTSAIAVYRPKNGPAEKGITVMYDKQVFEPDPLSDGLVERNPRITIETASISRRAMQDDRFDFKGIKAKVEHNEGDEMGLTSLRVRVIS